MNDEQIIEYVRNMIKANLQLNIQNGTGNVKVLMAEIFKLDDKDNKALLEHIQGVKALLERAEQIIESKSK